MTQKQARRQYRSRYGRRTDCEVCEGTGELTVKDAAVKCPACDGRGHYLTLNGPGFRAWARKTFSGVHVSPKLQQILQAGA